MEGRHLMLMLSGRERLNSRLKILDCLSPKEIAVDEDNSELLEIFMKGQDRLRGIDYNDYFNFLPKLSRNS